MPKRSKSIPCGSDLETEIVKITETDLRVTLDALDLAIDLLSYADFQIEQWVRELRVVGLVESRRVVRRNRAHIFFKRQNHARQIESVRIGLGHWGQSATGPRYSVCVCNYNMADTLERAMGSVASQLDPSLYEIVVIDDGSSDNSIEVLERLTKKYTHFRYISLPRDPARRLGETRNLSIRAARGEYVLIHIDADDEWEPYLSDLMTLYHRMEEVVGYSFLLAGQQTGIAKRDFLLGYGPYENVYRYEDRNMMMRLAKEGKLLFLDYKVYRTRLARPLKKKILKTIRDSCSQLMYEMRQNTPKYDLIKQTLLAPIIGSKYTSFKISLLRAILILPIYLISRVYPTIINALTWDELHRYHESVRGTYPELMTRWGADSDISFLSEEAQKIYSYSIKNIGFRSSK